MRGSPGAPPGLVVLAGLDSPVMTRMLDHGLCQLRYDGPGSDGPVTRTVEYARHGHDLVSYVGEAARSRWWRSFSRPRPVDVRIRGAWYRGLGRAVTRDKPGWTDARGVYRGQHPRARVENAAPFVVITLRPRTDANSAASHMPSAGAS